MLPVIADCRLARTAVSDCCESVAGVLRALRPLRLPRRESLFNPDRSEGDMSHCHLQQLSFPSLELAHGDFVTDSTSALMSALLNGVARRLTSIEPEQEYAHLDAECDGFFVECTLVHCSVCPLQICQRACDEAQLFFQKTH